MWEVFTHMSILIPNAIPQLYNLNHNSTVPYTDTKVINASGEIRLTHIPKVGSVSIVNDILVYTADKTNIAPNQFNVVYNSEYDYIGADRIVRFHQSKAGKTVLASYIVAASPVDADVINPLIAFVNNFTGNFYTVDDLKNPHKAEVSWQNIVDHPVVATENVDGYISHLDQKKLNAIDLTIMHIAQIKVDGTVLKPNNDESIDIISSNTIRPIVDRDGKLRFDYIGSVASIPSMDGFVSSTDTRLSDARTPKTHQHGILDISGLDTALNNRALTDHKHTWADLSGKAPTAMSLGMVLDTDVRLNNARVPTPHKHTASQISDLSTYMDAKAPLVHEHVVSDITDVDDLLNGNGIPVTCATDLFEGNFTAHGLDVHADTGLNCHMWMGVGYVNNKRCAYDETVFFRALGPKIPTSYNSTDNTAYPILRGIYSSTEVNIGYQFRVATPNTVPGSWDGLSIEWKRSDETTWMSPVTTPSINNYLERGLTFRMNMGPTTKYSVGELWTASIGVGQTMYVDIMDNREIAFVSTASTQPEPAVATNAMRIAKITTNATSIVAVEDRRVGKKLRGTLRVATPAITSNSDELATTSFVISKIGGLPTTPVWEEVIADTDQDTIQVPVAVRYQDIGNYKFVAYIFNPLSVEVTYNIRINGTNASEDYRTTNVIGKIQSNGYMRLEGISDGMLGGPAMVSCSCSFSDGTAKLFTVYTADSTPRLENLTIGCTETGGIGTGSYIRGIAGA